MCVSVESLWCELETNITLHINYTSVKKKYTLLAILIHDFKITKIQEIIGIKIKGKYYHN